MTETLTESFCERCGTRYEFSAPTRLNPLRKTRGLIGGLKNYLTSQDALGDAFDDAMRTEESALATAQLDAFHDAFNFCIDCRQYTCVSCWNDDAGRCRTCVPVPGADDLAERLAASLGSQPASAVASAEITEEHVGLEAWPTHDLPADAVAANGSVADDSWATTPGAWTNAPPAQTYEQQEPTPTVGGFVGADGFVYETKEQADKVAATMLAEALAAEEATRAAAEEAARAAAELEAAQAAEVAAAAAASEEALASPVIAEEPASTSAAAELDEVPVEAAAPTEPVQAVQTEPEPVAAEAAAEPTRLRVVAWDEDTTLELEPEPIVARAEPEPEPEPVAATVEPVAETPVVEGTPAVSPEPEPVAAEAEPEPVAAEAEPEPVAAEAEPAGAVPEREPIAASAAGQPEPEEPAPVAPRIPPISETILHFPTRPAEPPVAQPIAAEDDTPELAARRAQLDILGLDGDTQPDAPAVLPYRSRGAAVSAAELAVLAAAGQRFWEASAREVASAVGSVGVQNCGECGLSLSANARFCRRCGTRQAQSA